MEILKINIKSILKYKKSKHRKQTLEQTKKSLIKKFANIKILSSKLKKP